jgi:hypothetical protein
LEVPLARTIVAESRAPFGPSQVVKERRKSTRRDRQIPKASFLEPWDYRTLPSSALPLLTHAAIRAASRAAESDERSSHSHAMTTRHPKLARSRNCRLSRAEFAANFLHQNSALDFGL